MGTFLDLEWVLESSLLVLMMLGIRKIFMGKIRYVAIYALWIVVLLRFVVPVNFVSTPVSVANVFSKPIATWENARRSEQKGAVAAYGANEVQFGENRGRTSQGNYNVKRQNGAQKTGSAADGMTSTVLSQAADIPSESNAGKSGDAGGIHWWIVLNIIRVAGMLLLCLWFILSNASLLRRIKRNRVLYGQRGKVNIYIVSGIKTPCLYGFLKPAIYLPAFLFLRDAQKAADREELGQMITHEFVHYRHRDHVWAVVRMLFVSAFWYNPFAWLAASYSKKDAELACDETVIRLLGEEKRFCYGEMLVRLAGQSRWGDFRYSMILMSKRGREMEQRIRAISERKKYSRWVLLPLAAALSVTIGITCSSGIGSLAGEKNTLQKTAAAPEDAAKGLPLLTDVSIPGAEAGTQNVASGPLASSAWVQEMAKVSGIPLYADDGFVFETVYAATYEEAFQRYIEVFTDAVNTGNTDQMYQVLLLDSDVYEQQCALVKNYYKRGIREKVKSCAIASVQEKSADCVEIDSREKIRVYYADQSPKTVKQEYRYTCERINRTWVITGMREVE